MKRRIEKRLDAYNDGALSEREKRRVEASLAAEPELQAHVAQRRALGQIVRDAWTEGPPAPPAASLIGVLRPAMARIDAERAAASPRERFKERLGELFRPGPVAALVGAAAIVLMLILSGSQNLGSLIEADPSGARDIARRFAPDPLPPNLLVQPATGVEAEVAPGTIYDLFQGEEPLLVLDSEDATIIWILPDDSLSRQRGTAGWA